MTAPAKPGCAEHAHGVCDNPACGCVCHPLAQAYDERPQPSASWREIPAALLRPTIRERIEDALFWWADTYFTRLERILSRAEVVTLRGVRFLERKWSQ